MRKYYFNYIDYIDICNLCIYCNYIIDYITFIRTIKEKDFAYEKGYHRKCEYHDTVIQDRFECL